MTAPFAISCEPTEFTIRAADLPEGDLDASLFDITVQYRGRGLWAVKRGSRTLCADGRWEFECRDDRDDDGWRATHRFDLDRALKLAREALPLLRINGLTAADLLTEREAP